MVMKNYDKSVEINHNPNWPYIFHHPYRILIIDDSGTGKTNVLLMFTKLICMSKINSNQGIN